MKQRFATAALIAILAMLMPTPFSFAQQDPYGEAPAAPPTTAIPELGAGGNDGGNAGNVDPDTGAAAGAGAGGGAEVVQGGDGGANPAPAAADGGECGTPVQGAVALNAANMSGEAETPPGDPNGVGAGTFWIKDNMLWFKLEWSAIDKPNLAHIHTGAEGQVGDPLVTIFEGEPVTAGCVVASADTLKKITDNPAGFYLNIHNDAFPKGAIRAQLAAGDPELPFTGPVDTARMWLIVAFIVAGVGVTMMVGARRYAHRTVPLGARGGRHTRRR